MSLETKRMAHEYQESRVAHWQSTYQGILGTNVEVEIDVPSMIVDRHEGLSAEKLNGFVEDVHFVPLQNALTDMCADDFSKQALAEAITKIVITGAEGIPSNGEYTLVDGVLTIKNVPYTNTNAVDTRQTIITRIINEAL